MHKNGLQKMMLAAFLSLPALGMGVAIQRGNFLLAANMPSS